MKSARDVLEKRVFNHNQPCDCLVCRKGGKLDQALQELSELVEKRLEEMKSPVIGKYKMEETAINVGIEKCIDRIKELFKAGEE